MTDATTGRPMRVSKADRSGPYLIIPLAQVSAVKRIFDQMPIRYWVSEIAISLDGEPATTVVHFGKTTDPDAIQSLLDGVA